MSFGFNLNFHLLHDKRRKYKKGEYYLFHQQHYHWYDLGHCQDPEKMIFIRWDKSKIDIREYDMIAELR